MVGAIPFGAKESLAPRSLDDCTRKPLPGHRAASNEGEAGSPSGMLPEGPRPVRADLRGRRKRRAKLVLVRRYGSVFVRGVRFGIGKMHRRVLRGEFRERR